MKSSTELLSVTCCMGSHSVSCHPTQLNRPRLNLSQTGRFSIYLPRGIEGWVDLVLVIYPDGLPICTGSPIQVVTSRQWLDRESNPGLYDSTILGPTFYRLHHQATKTTVIRQRHRELKIGVGLVKKVAIFRQKRPLVVKISILL